MSLINLFSLLISLAAMGWSIVILWRLRDWRVGFLTILLMIMSMDEILKFTAFDRAPTLVVTFGTEELSGLVVSLIAFLAVFFLERILTDRKRTEEALWGSSQFNQQIIANVHEGVIVCDRALRYVAWNPFMEELSGLRAGEVLGKHPWELFPYLQKHGRYTLSKKSVDRIQASLKEALTGRAVSIPDTPLFMKDTGITRWKSSTYGPLRNRQDEIIGVIATVQDITERKKLGIELKLRDQRLNAFFNASTAGLAINNAKLGFVQINETLAQINGVPVEEHLGKTIQQILPKLAPTLEPIFQRVLSTGNPILNVELHGETPKQPGVIRHWIASYFPIIGETGQLDHVGVVVMEITDRKQAEEEIKRRNQELAALNTITAAVSSSLELPQVLGTLRRLLEEELDIPGGAIFFYNDTADRLDLKVGWGLPAPMREKFKMIPVAEFHNERVIRKKETVLTQDFRTIPLFLALGLDVARPEWQSDLSVPLIAKDEVQGVLELFSRTPAVFLKEQVDFFSALGLEVGVAIQNAQLFEQVRTGRERLQALSQRLVEVQETERRRIARELHDEIGQVLTGLKLTLDMSMRLPKEATQARFGEVQSMVDDLISRVRELSLELRPAMLDDLGLLPALLWHFERYTSQTHVRVKFEHHGCEERFRPDVETAAYRIVQEALTNVARHAGVGEAKVRLWKNPEALVLQIEDQGDGFDPASVSETGTTSGLSGMRERAVLLGGQLSIESSPGGGTRLTAELPLGAPISKRKKRR